jgi:hypothetical protein
MATLSSFKRIKSDSIIDGAVTGALISDGAVTTDKIANNSVQTADIADQAVTSAKLSNTLDLSSKTVTYRPFVNADFADNTITGAKMSDANTSNSAARTNLGFTPLRKDGGNTHSGQFTVGPSSSLTGPGIQFNGDADTGIIFSGNTVTLVSGGKDSLIVTGGRPREPYRPAFYASGRGGWYYASSFGGGGSWRQIDDFTWNVTQQGGANCASTGLFTAPVGGYYQLYAQTYYYNDTNLTDGYIHWNIGKNGSPTTMGRTPYTIFAYGLPNNNAPGIMVNVNFHMSTSDYTVPQPYWPAPATLRGRMHGDHSLWCGFLVG